MPTVEYWIQIENHAWDACPNNFDRMMGMTVNPNPQPVAGSTPNRPMAKPLDREALILRRYTPNWAAPDDRKINPWDVNEPDPRQTLGTIPGPVIECNLATRDDVLVHFRNMDVRVGANGDLLDPKRRAHSLHPHGFAFESRFDGAYPLSPPDPNQPVGTEVAAWTTLGVSGNKKGDRVPGPTALGGVGGTFTYHWQTIGWPTTAGVWLYHDHSICDMDNVTYGAIGLIVIHNVAADPEDFLDQDLPGGDPNGSPVRWICRPPPFPFPIDPSAIGLIGQRLGGPLAGQGTGATGALRGSEVLGAPPVEGSGGAAMGGMTMGGPDEEVSAHQARQRKSPPDRGSRELPEGVTELEDLGKAIDLGHLALELDQEELRVARLCYPVYRQPPGKALYLQLYHELGDAGFCINGRRFLGNTPTVIGGPNTHMRFGVVGMGNMFHTFHIHGHRWVIPGPHGTDLGTIQSSPQDQAVSQFEDTRIFGPANSFNFTVHEDAGFMRPPPGAALGEWHMHCHVLQHMDVGMMGSLLIIDPNGGFVSPLPFGTQCPPITQTQPPPPNVREVRMAGAQFSPKSLTVPRGTIISFINDDTQEHSATSDDGTSFDSSPMCSFTNLGACLPAGGGAGSVFSWTTPTTGTFPRAVGYHCRLHGAPGAGMFGTITIT